MRLLSLRVENFGLFRGTHYFDLTSRDEAKNITLFVGHNGAGKSTLFRAIAVALHGPLALGSRFSQPQYSEFLYNRLHRCKDQEVSTISSTGSVGLSFDCVQSGVIRRVNVSRWWRRNKRDVEETLAVTCDSQILGDSPTEAQAWLNELLPPGMAGLCFFDAEDLDTLAGADQRNPQLGFALQRLLGLDIVQRLQADLRLYTLREGGNSTINSLRETVLAHQARLEIVDRNLNNLRERATDLKDEEDTERNRLAEQERRLAAAGGLYAARRTLQQERIENIQKEIQAIEVQMVELSAHLLPFTLAPQLCRLLSVRLTDEAEAQRQQIANTLVKEQLAQISSVVSAEDFLSGLRLSQERQSAIRKRVQDILRLHQLDNTANISLLHHLAAPEREQLQAWIPQVLVSIPKKIQEIGARLRQLHNDRRTIELDLQRAPEEEDLAPIHTELLLAQEALKDVERRRKSQQEEIGALQYQHDDEDRQMQRAIDRLTEAQSSEHDLVLAALSRSVLRAFEDALTRQKVTSLEQILVKCFNVLCQKEHLLAAVSIDPDDFAVKLESTDGRILSLSTFSAGERQLYALALLQAMRQVSGHELPLLIDTPLARLDEEHRQRLMHNYLPSLGTQVLLFATDAEVGTELQTRTEPFLAQVYYLQFDPEEGATQSENENQMQGSNLQLDIVQELRYAF